MGSAEGVIALWNADKKQEIMTYFTQNDQINDDEIEVGENKVVDLYWNPGEDNFLALFSDSNLILYAQDEKQPKVQFELQPSGISRVSWLDTVSGDFLTASTRIGVLRLWNAAQHKPKDVIKVSRHGIVSIVPCQRDHFLLQLASGQIVVFNSRTRKTIFTT